MKPVRYVLTSGDTLWSIAGTHYGDPGRWPDLYAYNNRPDIVPQTDGRSSTRTGWCRTRRSSCRRRRRARHSAARRPLARPIR